MGGKHWTEEENIERVKKIIKDENLPYTFCGFVGKFDGVKTKMIIKCAKHGEYTVSINGFVGGCRCAKCKGVCRLTKDEVRKRILNRISTEKLPYSFVDFEEGYHSIASKVIIKCNACNYEWHVSANHFFGRKSYCPKCTKRRTYTIQEREKQIREIIDSENLDYDFYGLDFTDVKKTVTSKARVILHCRKHNYDWSPRVVDFVNNRERGPLCRGKSKSEEFILQFLKKNNIQYLYQHSFSGCKFKNRMPFDFYLPNQNMCIEYDGIHHFEPTTFGGDLEDAKRQFELTKKKDKIKDDFCKSSGIRLLRIKYCDFDTLENILRTELT